MITELKSKKIKKKKKKLVFCIFLEFSIVSFATSTSVHPISLLKTLVHMQGMSRWMDWLSLNHPIKVLEPDQNAGISRIVCEPDGQNAGISWALEFLGFCEPDKNRNFLVLLWNTRSKCWNYHDFFRTCTVEMLDFLGFCEPISRMQDLWGFPHGQNVGIVGICLWHGTVKMLECPGFGSQNAGITRILCEPYGQNAGDSFVNSMLKIKARFSFWPVAHCNRLIWLVAILSWVFFRGTTIGIFSLQI